MNSPFTNAGICTALRRHGFPFEIRPEVRECLDRFRKMISPLLALGQRRKGRSIGRWYRGGLVSIVKFSCVAKPTSTRLLARNALQFAGNYRMRSAIAIDFSVRFSMLGS
jgi:hypothetical protein